MNLQSLIIPSFALGIVIFEKSACQQSHPHPSRKPRCVYEIYNRKIEASQLSNCVVLECPNKSHFKNQNNYLGEIEDQLKE